MPDCLEKRHVWVWAISQGNDEGRSVWMQVIVALLATTLR